MFNGATASHDAIFVATLLAAVVGQFSDCRTTQVGLTNGLAEANAIGYWLIEKLGITGIYILKCLILPLIGLLLFALVGWNYGSALECFFAGLGFTLGIMNYRLIKKWNPGLKVF
jgi:hypothetical protein